MTKIWTLDSRDTVLFELAMQDSKLSFADLGPELRTVHAQTVAMLGSKGIRYEELRSALVPQTNPECADIAIVFDTGRIDEGWYGFSIAARLLPLLDREWHGSILQGDLIHRNEDAAFGILSESLQCHRPVEIASTRQLFAIYITNLNDRRKQKLLAGLREYEPFVGFMITHCESRQKNWLSVTLVNTYLKHGATFIGPHEPDIEEAAERNLAGWPLDRYGYRSVTVPNDLHFNPFLSYRIERALHPGSLTDTLHGLSTISDDPQDLGDLTVFVDPRKIDYLRSAKANSLEVAGLRDVTAGEVEVQIAAKVQQNYIYELEQRPEHNLSKFSVVLEF